MAQQNVNVNVDALAEVFHKLELSDLLVIGIVCKQWFRSIVQCCGQVHSLTFLIGDGAVQLRDSSQEIFPSVRVQRNERTSSYHLEWSCLNLSEEDLRKIGNTFTNVTHFEIAMQLLSSDDIEQLISLLKTLKPKLECLKVTIRFSNTSEDECKMFKSKVKLLLEKLNKLTALKQLTLVFHNALETQLDLAVLRRLNEFHFSSPNNLEILFSSLVKHVNPTSPVSIDIRNKLTCLKKLANLRKIGAKFVQLDIAHELVNQSPIKLITDKFTSLTTLSIIISRKLSFNKLAESLAKLVNLTNLGLFVNFCDPTFVVWDKDVLKRDVPRLSAIKYLTLEVITRKREDLLSINFEWIFPSVEKVKFVDRHVLHRHEFRNVMAGLAEPLTNAILNVPCIARLRDGNRTEQESLALYEQDRDRLAHLFGVLTLMHTNMGLFQDIVWNSLENESQRNPNEVVQMFDHEALLGRRNGAGDGLAPEQPPFEIEEQSHRDEPRDQFIKDYLRHLEQSLKLKCVEVYTRNGQADEISKLLHSYKFNEQESE